MKKYLFNDGTNIIKEVHSSDELKSLLRSCSDPSRTRIWVFDTNQWLSYSDFVKAYNFSITPEFDVRRKESIPSGLGDEAESPGWKRKIKGFLIFIGITAIAILVYNFTRIKWEEAGAVSITASRPANTPEVNMDSLIRVIETQRGQGLDKATNTNFRIRNTWPDKVSLTVSGKKFTNKQTNKYEELELSIDNSTGYLLDNAIVGIKVWKKEGPDHFTVNSTDTFRFFKIGYVMPVKRKIQSSFRGDSISLFFSSIKSKAFNFCYSAEKQSNYGNLNDRWYCKD